MERIKSLEDYERIYKASVENPEGFWSGVASTFKWRKMWNKTLDWNFKDPDVKWFSGGKLNITENCIDRHLDSLGDKPAIIWEPNNPEEEGRVITYKGLYMQVCAFCHVLKNNGVKKGDRVCIYMPMVPELAIAVLACARIGAIHSVVFGGFSAQSIADRILDADCRFVITADGAIRGTKEIHLKNIVDDALVRCPDVQKVIVTSRTNTPASMIKGRDVWWESELKRVRDAHLTDFPAEEMESEDPLFILYTSGSTGKPKGVVHSCGGYMVYTGYTFNTIFDYQPGEVFFCTADIGWITGHSYLVYGPLSQGATTVMFEGIPTYPDAGRFWDIVEKYKVNIFYTAPTAIRSLMNFDAKYHESKDLSSLRILGSVGEPINKAAWEWYHKNIGKEKCYIVDTWWQTETGGVMIAPIPNATKVKPCFATNPLPGIQPVLVDENGKEIEGNDVNGNLCIKFPWPSIIRTTYGDHQRCRDTYFSVYENMYFTGDGCLRDADGHYRITGRVDDVLNVSGHRIGTAEVENAINQHAEVVESAVVGYPHDIKGQGVYAYVICSEPRNPETIKQDILETVTRIIGPIAKPDKIQLVSGLPKTRSGKIMRRILRKVAEGELENLGDTSTLLDPAIVEEIKAGRL